MLTHLYDIRWHGPMYQNCSAFGEMEIEMEINLRLPLSAKIAAENMKVESSRAVFLKNLSALLFLVAVSITYTNTRIIYYARGWFKRRNGG